MPSIPGFGFLSENARFAELCEKCHIRFIGPPAEVIHRMGDKAEARKTMMAAGVPVIPGSKEPVSTVEEGIKTAGEIGLSGDDQGAPGGGGGKGMRGLLMAEDDFASNFQNAQMESVKGFSDDSMYIERFVEHPRHIEFQILADQLMEMWSIWESGTAPSRGRHQKILEEAPSAAISEELRERMGEAAVKAARAVRL